MGLIIESIEYYLPENILTNNDLQKLFPEWDLEKIVEKSGVYQRHIADKHETAYDLSIKACNKLFQNYDKNKIDGIIYCTQSPDYIMPPNSFLLHKSLEMNDEIFAYDFNHACTGYIYCLGMANAFFEAGMAKNILIVNTDTYSKYINKKDKSTRVLFGDGAAATFVQHSENGKGLIDILFGSSGSGYKNFWIPAGGNRNPKSDTTSIEIEDEHGNIRTKNDIQMEGFGVWSFVNSVIPKQVNELLLNNNIILSEIDQFIFHQASLMTLQSIIRLLKVDDQKVFINIHKVGNTVSASIPIAIKDALEQKIIGSGSKIVLSGFGVGLSYGSILMDI